MIRVNNSQEEEPEIPINQTTKGDCELEIETLQNAPRDVGKLRRLLETKQRQKEEEADHIEVTQRLVTEIEMLKVVLFLVCRDNRRKEEENKKK